MLASLAPHNYTHPDLILEMSKLNSLKSIRHSYIHYDYFCEDNLFDFQVLCLWRPCSTHFKLAVIVNQQNCAKVVRLVSEQKSAGLVRVKCLSPPTTVSGICRMVPPSVPPTLVPVYADLTSPIGQPPLGVGGTSGMWKLCILGRELLVNDHLPLVIPHFTAKGLPCG